MLQIFKTKYEKAIKQWSLDNLGQLPTNASVAMVSCTPRLEAFSVDIIKSGFQRAGISPLNLDVTINWIIEDGATISDTFNCIFEDDAFELVIGRSNF